MYTSVYGLDLNQAADEFQTDAQPSLREKAIAARVSLCCAWKKLKPRSSRVAPMELGCKCLSELQNADIMS
jgi:hypothetical protein